jgi:co-chaperonin GroES (HSP10)
MKLVPGPKRILVEFVPVKDQSVGGIYIPDEAQNVDIVEAAVIGSERFSDKDKQFEPGDNIIFRRDGAAEIEIRNEKYLLVHEDNVIAVINLSKPKKK